MTSLLPANTATIQRVSNSRSRSSVIVLVWQRAFTDSGELVESRIVGKFVIADQVGDAAFPDPVWLIENGRGIRG